MNASAATVESAMSDLLNPMPHIVTTGIATFADDLVEQGVPVTRVDWRPPPPGTEGDLADVALDARRVDANEMAVRRMLAAGAELVDVRPAREVLGLEVGQFLHAGPPIGWERASGPLRGALMGAAAFEGLVADPEEAAPLFASGALTFEPCHHHGAVGPMAGVVSPSMWMFVLE